MRRSANSLLGFISLVASVGLAACTATNDMFADTLGGGSMDGGDGDSIGDGDEGDPTGGDDGGEDHGTVWDVGVGDLPMDEGTPKLPHTCEAAWKFPSSIGCEFYGVDLDQPGLFDQDPFAIAVANPQPAEEAFVSIRRFAFGQWLEVESGVIAPGEHFLFTLPAVDIFGTGLFEGVAYRVESDIPVGAVQWSGVAGPEVPLGKSSSASSLHPVSGWQSELRALGWRTHNGVGESAFLTVLGALDSTTVTIEPSVATASGPSVPPIQGGDSWQGMLEARGSVLQFAALSTDDELDMGIAGTRIFSGAEHPISIFAAHTCAGLPDYQGTCGHLQEQISPMLAGTRFVAPAFPVRDPLDPPPVLWQVQVLENGTEIAFEGEVEGLPEFNVVMQAGTNYGLWIDEGFDPGASFEIFADKPVMVAAYVTNPATNDQGSAAMVQLAPAEVYFPDHLLVTPDGYGANFLVITRHVGDLVTLDGVAIDDASFFPVAAGGFEVAQVAVKPGLHRVMGDETLMVVATGHDVGDAYAHLGAWGTPVPDYPAPG